MQVPHFLTSATHVTACCEHIRCVHICMSPSHLSGGMYNFPDALDRIDNLTFTRLSDRWQHLLRLQVNPCALPLQGEIVNDVLVVEDIIGIYDGNHGHAMKKLATYSQYGKFTIRNSKLLSIERMPLPA